MEKTVKTRTHFAFRIDTWTADGENIVVTFRYPTPGRNHAACLAFSCANASARSSIPSPRPVEHVGKAAGG